MRFCLLFLFGFLAINAFGTVHADFTANKFNGCPPLLSNFSSTSTTSGPGPIIYRWTFSNGGGSRLANPSKIFNTSGVYSVSLVVLDSVTRETDSISKQVVVYRLPVVNFTAADTDMCYGDSLFLFSTVVPGDAPVTDYAWGFGNGVASSTVNPAYVYPTTGTFDVTLVVQDSNHCSVNLTKPQYATVTAYPDAAFYASPATTCASSQLVSFTNTSSTGAGITYSWDLNAGVTSNAVNPTYTYSDESYNVRLTVTNAHGCESRASHRVTVTELVADFYANKTEACTNQPIHFTNISNLIGHTWWDFGNGITSTANDDYVSYTAPGVYTVTMITTYGNCVDTVVKINYITIQQGSIPSFSINSSPVGCNEPVEVSFNNTTTGNGQFTWAFGDATNSTDVNPTHTYTNNGTFAVTLAVTDSNGCQSLVTNNFTVATYLPIPDFYSDTLVCKGGKLNFYNSTPLSSAPGTFMFTWYFGDGDSVMDFQPYHIYDQTGYYTVRLHIHNIAGCDTEVVKTHYVHVDELETDFTVDKTFSPCPPLVTVFSSTCNKVGVTYAWDFGDGKADTAQNPTHIYFQPGIFTVKLKVETPNGCVDEIVYPHLVEVQGPYGVFGATPNSGCIPMEVEFTAAISANTQYLWCDMGDGTLVSDSTMFSHTYTFLGTFNPKFILVDHVGCTVPYDLPPITTHIPAALNLVDTAICIGASIEVPSQGNEQYHWEASPDITCDTCSALSITPSQTSDYVLHATNQFCTVTDTLHVFVDTLPVLTPSTVKVCSNTAVELHVGNAYRISWTPNEYISDTASLKPTVTPLDSVVYTATGYNSLGCSTSTTVTVNTLDKLDISAVGDVTTCAFDSFHLSSTVLDGPDAGVHYAWSPAAYLSAADVANPVGYGLNATTTFFVVASAQTCASDTASVLVHINALPVIHMSESVTTTPNAPVELWANSTQDLTYVWNAADSFSCTECRRTTLYPAQTQTVYVTGTNDFGCRATDSVEIKVVACDPESVFMPNVFTPNNDGLNDNLGLTSKALASLSYFRVFDEWGRMVYETKNMNDTWDGTVNGQPVAINAFVYVLSGKCQNGGEVMKYGNITVVR